MLREDQQNKMRKGMCNFCTVTTQLIIFIFLSATHGTVQKYIRVLLHTYTYIHTLFMLKIHSVAVEPISLRK